MHLRQQRAQGTQISEASRLQKSQPGGGGDKEGRNTYWKNCDIGEQRTSSFM